MDLSNFSEKMLRSLDLMRRQGIDLGDITQSDMLCYDVPTNERYDTIKVELGSRAAMLDESLVNGRFISVFQLDKPLVAHGFSVSYIELPQPKSGDEEEGIDHIQFVTRLGASRFIGKYPGVDFTEKGNRLNRLLQIHDSDARVRFHDKHIGSVLELEALNKG